MYNSLTLLRINIREDGSCAIEVLRIDQQPHTSDPDRWIADAVFIRNQRLYAASFEQRAQKICLVDSVADMQDHPLPVHTIEHTPNRSHTDGLWYNRLPVKPSGGFAMKYAMLSVALIVALVAGFASQAAPQKSSE